MSRISEGLLFSVLSRIPVLGDAPILVRAAVRAGHRAREGQWGEAAAEITSGACQALGDTFIPVLGRDVGQEAARAFVRNVLKKPYLEDRSLLLGPLVKILEKRMSTQHAQRSPPAPKP